MASTTFTIGSGNDLGLGDTKSLPEPMLIVRIDNETLGVQYPLNTWLFFLGYLLVTLYMNSKKIREWSIGQNRVC